jgi:deoxyribodipyrimidine photo-lyase
MRRGILSEYVPELAKVPASHIRVPWLMSAAEQNNYRAVIGVDYPAPIVDHANARKATLTLYGKAKRRTAAVVHPACGAA